MTISFQVSLTVPLGTVGVTEVTIITATSQLSSTVQDPAIDTTFVKPYQVYLPVVLKYWHSPPIPPPGADPYEPNDAMDIAYIFPVVASATATDLNFIPSDTDQDWFAFYVKTGKTYQAYTENLTGVDTYLEVFDKDGSLVVEDDDSGGGFASKVEWQALYTGFYYIKVTNLIDFSTALDTCDLTVEES